jgi:hypothetical protein
MPLLSSSLVSFLKTLGHSLPLVMFWKPKSVLKSSFLRLIFYCIINDSPGVICTIRLNPHLRVSYRRNRDIISSKLGFRYDKVIRFFESEEKLLG